MLFAIISAINIVANISLGVAAYRSNQKSRVNRYFLLYTLAVAFWVGCMQYSLFNESLQVVRLCMLASGLMTLSQYLFLRHLLDVCVPWYIENTLIMCAVLLSGIAVIPIAGVTVIDSLMLGAVNQIVPIPGSAFVPFGIFFVSLTIYNFFIVSKLFQSKNPRVKAQAPYIFCGFVIAYLCILIFDFILVNVFHRSEFIGIGTTGILFFTSAVVFAMTRYRFLDVRVQFHKVYVSYVGIAALTLVYIISGIALWLSISHIDLPFEYYVLFVVTLIIFYIFLLHHHARFSAFFIRQIIGPQIDFSKFMHENGLQLNSQHELVSFSFKYVGMIQETMEAPVCSLYVYHKNKEQYDQLFPKKSSIVQSENIIAEISAVHDYIHLQSTEIQADACPEIAELLWRHRAEVLVPLFEKISEDAQKVIGFFTLGKHKNGKSLDKQALQKLPELVQYGETSLPIILHWQDSIEQLQYSLKRR